MAARFTHLTTRQDNRLARQQARSACAAALLRRIHVVVTRHVSWVPPSPPRLDIQLAPGRSQPFPPDQDRGLGGVTVARAAPAELDRVRSRRGHADRARPGRNGPFRPTRELSE